MPVRTRRMKNSEKGAKLPEESFSSDEDTEMSPPAKSMNLLGYENPRKDGGI